jgi:hypothetical protein
VEIGEGEREEEKKKKKEEKKKKKRGSWSCGADLREERGGIERRREEE